MITGRKQGEPTQAIAGSRWVVGVVVAALVLAFWLDLVSIPGIDIRVGAAKVVGLPHGEVHTGRD